MAYAKTWLMAALMTWTITGNTEARDNWSLNRIYNDNVKSLQSVVNDDWLSPTVMTLGENDILKVSFDELSHDYHRYIYRLEHCEADWTTSTEIFESDFLEGFNDNPIEDYEHSINTNVLYTHYRFTIPNDRCRIRMSGNYRIVVYDDSSQEKVMEVRFMVVDPKMSVSMSMSTNTDIDVNQSHQQLTMSVNYGQISVTNPDEQIYTIVTQNGRLDNMKKNVRPNLRSMNELKWSHCKEMIFEAGNEYHKYETLALDHPTMGIDHIHWDGHNHHVYPFASEVRRNYLYDEDANGAFIIRNSDYSESDITCDYAYVHLRLAAPFVPDRQLMVQGNWTTDALPDHYVASYNDEAKCYELTLLQKQGYYSYQYVIMNDNGTTSIPSSEGSFFQTENKYQAYVYYKPTGGRTWLLTGYRQLDFCPSRQ